MLMSLISSSSSSAAASCLRQQAFIPVARHLLPALRRGATVTPALQHASFSTHLTEEQKQELQAERESTDYDVCIVGGGPSGLAAAIQIRKLCQSTGKDLSVCILEKGSEIGDHILSGNVFEPRALNELIPDWKEKGAPLDTPVTDDSMLFLTQNFMLPCPTPPSLHNDGNYIISLGALCKWMAAEAEELGVDIFPGFAASEVLFGKSGEVVGVATGDVGIDKTGAPKPGVFARGMELRAKATLFAEGARGSLSQQLMDKFGLRKTCDPQTYGIGFKEVWELDEKDREHSPGTVLHTLGWPLQSLTEANAWGGSFVYHMNPNKVLVGFVVGLDYENPYLSPYREFQRFKHHPIISAQIGAGKPVAYGARVLNEGGLQSIPELIFPGGALVGCSAGFLNVAKIKGTHTAMKSGIECATSTFEALTGGSAGSDVLLLNDYPERLRESWVWDELHQVRNLHPAFHKMGFLPWMGYSALETFLLKGRTWWTFGNDKTDAQRTKPASEFKPIEYPKPDGKLSFDILTNLARSGTNHEHDQPIHLKIKEGMEDVPVKVSYEKYAGPESRFCPAGVYEFTTDDDGSNPQLVRNAQNCLHCKACDIKTPENYIKWTVPEGSGGPAYAAAM